MHPNCIQSQPDAHTKVMLPALETKSCIYLAGVYIAVKKEEDRALWLLWAEFSMYGFKGTSGGQLSISPPSLNLSKSVPGKIAAVFVLDGMLLKYVARQALGKDVFVSCRWKNTRVSNPVYLLV